jgi:hypothetical protein
LFIFLPQLLPTPPLNLPLPPPTAPPQSSGQALSRLRWPNSSRGLSRTCVICFIINIRTLHVTPLNFTPGFKQHLSQKVKTTYNLGIEKVYITSSPIATRLLHSLTYKIRYLTPSPLQNRSNNPLRWFCHAGTLRWILMLTWMIDKWAPCVGGQVSSPLQQEGRPGKASSRRTCQSSTSALK